VTDQGHKHILIFSKLLNSFVVPKFRKIEGGERLKKKCLALFVVILLFSMLTTQLAMASSYEEKNNPKFKTFEVNQQQSLTTYLIALSNPTYIQSEDRQLRLIIGPYEDQIVACKIKVDGIEYIEGVDFDYVGSSTYEVWRPTGESFMGIYPLGDLMLFKIEYTYDFGEDGQGIDGKINMRATWLSDDFFSFISPGSFKITSIDGTGDLQNVNIKATNGVSAVGSSHVGTVIGWPID
jgi:hypothetical protein